MKKRIRILLLIVVIGLGVWVYHSFFKTPGRHDTLTLSGNIEVTETRLSFKISGRMAERLVDEGDIVKRGQLVALLESTDQEIAVSGARASLSYAKAVLSEFEAGSRKEDIRKALAMVKEKNARLRELQKGYRTQEIETSRAEVERAGAILEGAKAQFELAKADYERHRNLRKDGVVSESEYDLVYRRYESALSTYEEAKAGLRGTKENLDLRQEGTRSEQIAQARQALEQAEANYELIKTGPRVEAIEQAKAQADIAREALRSAEQNLTYTKLFSPSHGVVLSKAAEPGEYLNPGSPVVSIGNLDNVWLRAYVNEKDLGLVKLGQDVKVTTDAYPGKIYKGNIIFISSEAEFTPKAVQTFEERVKLMFRIKVDIQNPNWELKIGQPADARVKTGR